MPRRTNFPEKIRKLRMFLAQERRMPGYNEMLKLFEYRSKNAVHGLLLKLEQQGYISKVRGKIAPAGKLSGSVRLLGAVQAGFPSPAEEELMDTISLDEYLIERPAATFMLKVTGDSMTGAGTYPGDMVLVEKGAFPRTDDIVIAQVDGEWTLKFYVKDRDGVRLESANSAYPPIRPHRSLRIAGVVRALVRKYR